MEAIAVVGLELAKNVFQVHDVGADGGVVVSTADPSRPDAGVFRVAGAVPRRHRSLRIGASLGSRADGARSPGPTDAARPSCELSLGCPSGPDRGS
jgi:hypothetical protein